MTEAKMPDELGSLDVLGKSRILEQAAAISAATKTTDARKNNSNRIQIDNKRSARNNNQWATRPCPFISH